MRSLDIIRRAFPGFAILVMALALAHAPASRAQQNDQGVLAGFISQLLSTPSSRVTIGAVEGALSSNATIRNVSVADPQGVYLRIDVIRLVWRRTALLSRRIEVQQLEIGKLELARRPVGNEASPPSSGPLLPELPLKLEVGNFSLGELVLGEPVLGVAARFSAAGRASLGPPAEGLQASFDIKRLDAAGQSILRLAFAPASQRLDFALQHDEPAGGIAARLMGIPGLPPVKLDVAGAGSLDDLRARLTFDAGAGINARGVAQLARAGALRRLALDVSANVENLLPPAVGVVFAGVSTLTGNIVFADDGGYGIERLRLASQLAELTIEGRLGADRILDVTAKARALPDQAGATRRGDVSLARLTFDATAKGPLNAPQVEGALDLGGLASPALKLDALSARLAVQPTGAQRGPLYRVAIDGRASGVAVADRGMSEALGDNGTLTLRGTVDDKAVADVSDARIVTPNLTLGFIGRSGAATLDGRARLEITQLSAFSTLAARRLAGRAFVQATLRGDPSASRVMAALDGNASDLSLGDAIADRLTGRRLQLTGNVATAPGVITLDRVTARGQFITAALIGKLAADDLGLQATVTLSDLAKLDPRLAGAARADARVAGAATDPGVSLRLGAAEMRALDRPIRNLEFSLEGVRLGSAPDVTIAGRGDVNGKPLAADIKASATAAGGWKLEKLTASLGSVSAAGEGQIDNAGLASGRLTLSAGDLDDLSPLVLTRLQGGIEARLVADATDRKQGVTVDANGQRLAAGAITLNAVRAALKGDDIYGRVVVNGEASIDRLVAGSENIERVLLTARSNVDASDLTLSAQARGFSLSAAGRLTSADAPRFDLASFAATRSGARIALASPATFTLQNGHVATERAIVSVQGGEIELSGKFGADLDLSVAARRIPLAAIDIVAPGTGLAGLLDGRATLRGAAAAPQGPFEATIKGLNAPQLRNAGLPALDVTARGQAAGDRATVNVKIAGGSAISFDVSGSAPLSPTGAFDLRARGALDAGLANAMLAGGGRRVAGRVTVDGALRGTRASPEVQGAATLSGGSFSDPLQGVTLSAIEGRVTGRGAALVVERLTAKAKNGGAISVSGNVLADPARGFPADLKITARGAELVSNDLASLVASLDLNATGPLATAPRLGGRVEVETMEIRVPDRLPSASEPLRDARHVAPPRQTRARLNQIARQRANEQRSRAPAFNAALDLLISAPARVFVRGRGIDAELGGDVRLAGSTANPRASGAFELRRGRLALLTQRLDFRRGRITFGGGDAIPDLDFLAETSAGGVTARVAVTGRASEPQFALSSSPALPQDEVLSQLLFARAAGGLSPFQAVQLAQAVAQLSGSAGGPDVFEQARRALGVDDLDVGMGAAGPTVGVSRAISDRVRIGVKAGSKPETSAVGADIDLTRRLKVQTEVGADGRAAVGIGAEIEY